MIVDMCSRKFAFENEWIELSFIYDCCKIFFVWCDQYRKYKKMNVFSRNDFKCRNRTWRHLNSRLLLVKYTLLRTCFRVYNSNKQFVKIIWNCLVFDHVMNDWLTRSLLRNKSWSKIIRWVLLPQDFTRIMFYINDYECYSSNTFSFYLAHLSNSKCFNSILFRSNYMVKAYSPVLVPYSDNCQCSSFHILLSWKNFIWLVTSFFWKLQ